MLKAFGVVVLVARRVQLASGAATLLVPSRTN
jgi:hypothetical protein